MLQASYFKRVFEFNFKARTSRGLMKDKTSWFITIRDPRNAEVFGIGECGPLPGLSIDHKPDFENIVASVVAAFNAAGFSDPMEKKIFDVIPPGHPSLVFALETALLDLAHGGKRLIFHNDFHNGGKIPINGLIWMGDMDFMMGQINIKVADGFRCIKLKVGGLDFERECDILHYLRNRYFRENITIRLDANGAFKPDDVLFKLEQLARFNVHSIEQPIKAGSSEMEELCRRSPIAVAFDEELIGKETLAEKRELLASLKPGYLVLKPMLHGGFRGCAEWIALAEELNIGWWVTSALESSVGLNAICQFTANYSIDVPQGLGTGTIYENNFESPLEVKQGYIFQNPKVKWDEQLDAESEQGSQDSGLA